MTVSNPASFSSIKAEFGGSNNFSQYYRGGPYVNSAQSSTISTTAAGLAMSQFNGVTKVVLTASASPGTWSYSTKVAGAYNSVTFTVTPAHNVGAVTYAWSLSDSTDWTAQNPTGASSYFTGHVNSSTGSIILVATCNIKDSIGQTASTSVRCTITWTGTIN